VHCERLAQNEALKMLVCLDIYAKPTASEQAELSSTSSLETTRSYLTEYILKQILTHTVHNCCAAQ
jgi:hypothetical protein